MEACLISYNSVVYGVYYLAYNNYPAIFVYIILLHKVLGTYLLSVMSKMFLLVKKKSDSLIWIALIGQSGI